MAWLQGDCFFLYIGNGLPILLSLTHVFYPHRVQNYHAFVSHWSPRVVQEARSTVTKKNTPIKCPSFVSTPENTKTLSPSCLF